MEAPLAFSSKHWLVYDWKITDWEAFFPSSLLTFVLSSRKNNLASDFTQKHKLTICRKFNLMSSSALNSSLCWFLSSSIYFTQTKTCCVPHGGRLRLVVLQLELCPHLNYSREQYCVFKSVFLSKWEGCWEESRNTGKRRSAHLVSAITNRNDTVTTIAIVIVIITIADNENAVQTQSDKERLHTKGSNVKKGGTIYLKKWSYVIINNSSNIECSQFCQNEPGFFVLCNYCK